MNRINPGIIIGAAVALALSVAAAFAADVKVGDLEIKDAYLRATAPGAPVAGGYMTIINHGSKADKLVGGACDFAGKVEIHEMKMDGGTMIMRPVKGGLEIPAGATVQLKPGGYHVMFMKLGEQLKPGEQRSVMLNFANTGEAEVNMTVKKMGAGMKMD